MDPVHARAGKTTLTFDGQELSVSKRQLGSKTIIRASIPVSQIIGRRWQEATATTRGFLQFIAPNGAGNDFQATFNRTEQHSFEALNAAVAQAINQHHQPSRGTIDRALTALATLLRNQELTSEEYTLAKTRLLT